MTSKEYKWYAVYTAPRAEKKVSERFTLAAIEHYLPLQKVKRQWSDRVKEVLIPVLNGYIFVYISELDFRKVTDTYGALAFVRQNSLPIAIPENQIERLRFMVDNADGVVEYCTDNFEKGEPISIIKGPLCGMIAELVEMKGKYKVMVRLEKFGCAMTTVPISFIEKISNKKSSNV